jgi:hypothetical protein
MFKIKGVFEVIIAKGILFENGLLGFKAYLEYRG